MTWSAKEAMKTLELNRHGAAVGNAPLKDAELLVANFEELLDLISAALYHK